MHNSIIIPSLNKVKDYQNLLIKNHNDVIKTTVRNDEKKRKQNDVGYQFRKITKTNQKRKRIITQRNDDIQKTTDSRKYAKKT